MEENSDLFFLTYIDLTTDITSTETEFEIRIPSAFENYDLNVRCVELNGLFRHLHPDPSVNANAWYGYGTIDPTSRDPMVATQPWDMIRVMSQYKTECMGINKESTNLLGVAYGGNRPTTYFNQLTNRLAAKYTLDSSYPIVLYKHTGSLLIKLEKTIKKGDTIKFNTSTSNYIATSGVTEWTPIYFTIKLRFDKV
jgi:hypothetical protein